MVLVIILFGFCVFSPGLLISFIVQFGTLLGITTEIASQIVCAVHIFAPIIAIIFFKLARYISWKQNDYKENTNPERYFKYNEELKRHKIECVSLTGKQFKTEDFEYNYNKEKAQQCPFYGYYHDEKGELRKNTKTPLELLLDLKKAYEIPKQFKNIESRAYGAKND